MNERKVKRLFALFISHSQRPQVASLLLWSFPFHRKVNSKCLKAMTTFFLPAKDLVKVLKLCRKKPSQISMVRWHHSWVLYFMVCLLSDCPYFCQFSQTRLHELTAHRTARRLCASVKVFLNEETTEAKGDTWKRYKRLLF